jgi:hypothetical protein
VALKLKAEATLKYRERRLPGAGRESAALRSVRYFEEADASIEVSQQTTSSRLRDARRLIVAEGRRDGVLSYSSAGPLTYNELQLLRVPGDSLAAVALLPPKEVEPGEKWRADSWVVQMLTATEAVLKSDLSCELVSVESGVAKVSFTGNVEGATDGASATVGVTGHYLFDIAKKHLKHLELTQTEKRSVGPVSPGMDVTAKMVLDRAPTNIAAPLDDALLDKVPLEPEPARLLLSFASPWDARFFYERQWHVFHQTEQLAVLRLLDKGSLIAQCNISRIPPAAPGKHTPETQFQNDIKTALGEKLKSIVKAEELPRNDKRFVYRVTAEGVTNDVPMHWIYYLCADPSGRQMAFVFAVETKLLERLGDRHHSIVDALEFLPPTAAPRTGP